jgi:hypothetical protein
MAAKIEDVGVKVKVTVTVRVERGEAFRALVGRSKEATVLERLWIPTSLQVWETFSC